MNRIAKMIMGFPCRGGVGKLYNIVNFDKYMKYAVKYYRRLGINIGNNINYISPDVYFDSTDYSLITIEDNVTISREVMFLTHDYSVHMAMVNIGWTAPAGKTAHYLRPIIVGNGSFIGARVSLLPGTNIGKNCIIGAGSVVKGTIPDDSIVIGNPSRVIANTNEWAQKKLNNKDWIL